MNRVKNAAFSAYLISILLTNFLLAQANSESRDNESNSSPASEQMESSGLNFSWGLKSDYFANVSGGCEQKSASLQNLDLQLEIDGEKLFSIPSTTILVYGIGNGGSSPSECIGDAQVVSNIDAPQTMKIFEAWVEHTPNSPFSLKYGLIDLNTEFDSKYYSGIFINSSHGIGVDFSQSGENGPSIFPNTSLGMRVSYQLSRLFSSKLAVFDGVSGDPLKVQGTQIHLRKQDGVLVVGEFGYQNGTESEFFLGAHAGLGGWFYSEKSAPLLDTQAERNFGTYLFFEKGASNIGVLPGKLWTSFLRIGIANDEVNMFSGFLGVGMTMKSIISQNDELGFAIAHATVGSPFKAANSAENIEFTDAETALELTWQFPVAEWFSIQPDVQYIISPGANPDLKNALVPGFRFEAGF